MPCDVPAPRSFPRCLLQTQKSCPAAVSAQHPVGYPRSGTGQVGGASSAGDLGHHLIAVPSCRLRTRTGYAGHAHHPLGVSPNLPPPPSSIHSWCQPLGWRRHLGAARCQAGAHPPGTLTPPPRSSGHRGVPALAAPAGQISGCPPAPAPSSPAWLAPCPAILRL